MRETFSTSEHKTITGYILPDVKDDNLWTNERKIDTIKKFKISTATHAINRSV